jgi:hypothetical protein
MRGCQALKVLTVLTVLSVSSTPLLAAQSLFAGTWKMNTAKSKSATDTTPKQMTLTYERVGDQWKQIGVGTDHAGNSINQNYLIAWDGKDHPVDEPGMTIAVTKVDTYTQNVTVKQNGEVIDSGQMLISKDGKTMTLSQDDDPNTVEVFEKR